jgi:hypothetical protein
MRAVPVPEVGETEAREREPRPHYHGHRKRLRDCLLQAGADALRDYESSSWSYATRSRAST